MPPSGSFRADHKDDDEAIMAALAVIPGWREEEEDAILNVDTGVDARGEPRRVRFRASPQVRPTIRRDDISPEEQAAAWMTGADLRRARRGIKKEVVAFRASAAEDAAGSSSNMRGLEHLRSASELETRQAAKSRCLSRVLRTQDDFLAEHRRRSFEERHLSLEDLERLTAELAKASVKGSAETVELALLLAQSDQEWTLKQRERDARKAARAKALLALARAAAPSAPPHCDTTMSGSSSTSTSQSFTRELKIRDKKSSGQGVDVSSSDKGKDILLARVMGKLDACRPNPPTPTPVAAIIAKLQGEKRRRLNLTY